VIEWASLVTVIETERLNLAPLVREHAENMFQLLADASLYEYTQDEPPSSLQALQERYAFLQARRSPDGIQAWLNWVLHESKSGETIGFVQATVTRNEADVAWVVGTQWQGQGYGTEAVEAMMSWLYSVGVSSIQAKINPVHFASQRVAEKVGLVRTNEVSDGEFVWKSTRNEHAARPRQ